MSICLSVRKDLVNRWTNMVLLYNVAASRFWEGLYVFLGRVPQPSQEKSGKDEFLIQCPPPTSLIRQLIFKWELFLLFKKNFVNIPYFFTSGPSIPLVYIKSSIINSLKPPRNIYVWVFAFSEILYFKQNQNYVQTLIIEKLYSQKDRQTNRRTQRRIK